MLRNGLGQVDGVPADGEGSLYQGTSNGTNCPRCHFRQQYNQCTVQYIVVGNYTSEFIIMICLLLK